MDTNTDRGSTVTAARIEADRMRATVADKDDDATIRMAVTQFRTLARLIERLADYCVDEEEVPNCWLGERAADAAHFRCWVPLRHFADARETIDACQAEIKRTRAQLRAREADYVRLTSVAFGLTAR